MPALDGVKVLDLTWSAAGPIATKWMGDHGATVVTVESRTRIDISRRSGPFPGGEPDPDRSGTHTAQNSSKYSITINMAKPGGHEIVRKLIGWADIFAETFTPGVVGRLGLDYERVRKIKDDIIYLSSSALGQTGPTANGRFFGTQLASLIGFTELTGWPDRPPVGLGGAYTDPIAARLTGMLVLAALDYRRRTGQGTYVDFSQVEGALQFLSPLFLSYQADGALMERAGNRSPHAAPHGVFPCKGDDRWIVVTAYTEAEWRALCDQMGRPSLAEEARFATLLARKQHEDELEEIIAGWTSGEDGEELMDRLQAAGVPAGAVANGEDLFNDPQLQHRGHHWYLEHSALGRHAYDGSPIQLSVSPPRPFAAPCLGEHTEYVLKDLLGYGEEEISDLVADGALE